MSCGFFSAGARRALEGVFGTGELSLYLLYSWPTGQEQSSEDCHFMDQGSAKIADSDWVAAEVNGVQVVQNSVPISFGALKVDVSGVVGWMLTDGSTPIAWGPLVDAYGAEVTRSFLAGDELHFPAGSIRIGVA